jgi:flagellar biosynthesis protein FlhG
MTRVISVSSGKGGVGKTTLVSNLGSLWSKHQRTLLIDGDWSLGKLGIALGVRPRWTVEEVLAGKISLQEAIVQINPQLSLLASPSGSLGFEEMSEETRRQLFFEMEGLGSEYDRILLDHSSGANFNVLEFAAACHQHIVVTTPEPTSYTDAYAIMKLLSKRFGIRHFWLLVTFSQDRAETETIISRFSEVVLNHLEVRLTLLDIFPWEPGLGESIRRQQAFVSLHPSSPISLQFERIVKRLDRSEVEVSHGLRFFYGQQDSMRQRDKLCLL